MTSLDRKIKVMEAQFESHSDFRNSCIQFLEIMCSKYNVSVEELFSKAERYELESLSEADKVITFYSLINSGNA